MAPETANPDTTNNAPPTPPFARCPKCNYSLTGLPANHQCPECGLKYDSNCKSYKAKKVPSMLSMMLFWFGFGALNIQTMMEFSSISWSTPYGIFKIFAAVIWSIVTPIVIIGSWKERHQVQLVAITTEGLFIRLPDHTEELIPWQSLKEAATKTLHKNKQHVVILHRSEDGAKPMEIDSHYDVFPTKADAERFVTQVNARIATLQEPLK